MSGETETLASSQQIQDDTPPAGDVDVVAPLEPAVTAVVPSGATEASAQPEEMLATQADDADDDLSLEPVETALGAAWPSPVSPARPRDGGFARGISPAGPADAARLNHRPRVSLVQQLHPVDLLHPRVRRQKLAGETRSRLEGDSEHAVAPVLTARPRVESRPRTVDAELVDILEMAGVC